MEVFLTNADAIEVWQLMEAVIGSSRMTTAFLEKWVLNDGFPTTIGQVERVFQDSSLQIHQSFRNWGEGYRAKALHLSDARHRQPLLFEVSSGLAFSRKKR